MFECMVKFCYCQFDFKVIVYVKGDKVEVIFVEL